LSYGTTGTASENRIVHLTERKIGLLTATYKTRTRETHILGFKADGELAFHRLSRRNRVWRLTDFEPTANQLREITAEFDRRVCTAAQHRRRTPPAHIIPRSSKHGRNLESQASSPQPISILPESAIRRNTHRRRISVENWRNHHQYWPRDRTEGRQPSRLTEQLELERKAEPDQQQNREGVVVDTKAEERQPAVSIAEIGSLHPTARRNCVGQCLR
jgi:hypothetical protein